jgi:hypothetical protein
VVSENPVFRDAGADSIRSSSARRRSAKPIVFIHSRNDRFSQSGRSPLDCYAFVMRRMMLPLILVLCFASNAVGQATWSLPKLKELDQSNAIGKGSIQLSADEKSLLRKLTHRITSSCVSDPGPGDPKSAEGIFKSLRVVRVDLTAKGDSSLIVQGKASACVELSETVLFGC